MDKPPMHYQINVTQGISGSPPTPNPTVTNPAELASLLQQILEVNRDQAGILRSLAGAQDQTNRWRSFLQRCEQPLPELGPTCRQALPILEGVFARSIQEITDRLVRDGEELENEFYLQEFLDRFGNRITQLATLMNMVGPLAEASNSKDPPQQSA